jgi:hypothetical protein
LRGGFFSSFSGVILLGIWRLRSWDEKVEKSIRRESIEKERRLSKLVSLAQKIERSAWRELGDTGWFDASRRKASISKF